MAASLSSQNCFSSASRMCLPPPIRSAKALFLSMWNEGNEGGFLLSTKLQSGPIWKRRECFFLNTDKCFFFKKNRSNNLSNTIYKLEKKILILDTLEHPFGKCSIFSLPIYALVFLRRWLVIYLKPISGQFKRLPTTQPRAFHHAIPAFHYYPARHILTRIEAFQFETKILFGYIYSNLLHPFEFSGPFRDYVSQVRYFLTLLDQSHSESKLET